MEAGNPLPSPCGKEKREARGVCFRRCLQRAVGPAALAQLSSHKCCLRPDVSAWEGVSPKPLAFARNKIAFSMESMLAPKEARASLGGRWSCPCRLLLLEVGGSDVLWPAAI